jgi:hypothetical protein
VADLTPADVWRVERNVCGWCSEPIHMTPLIEYGISRQEGGLGDRIVEIWTHVASGHERCTGRDTCATPANLREP